MTYPIRETELAERAGLARGELKKMRDSLLVEGEDWCLQKNAVCLTEQAALALLEGLEVSSPANLLEELLGDPEAKKGPPEKGAAYTVPESFPPALSAVLKKSAARTVATVVKLPLNTRFLAAVLADGRSIKVRVRNNRMFALKQVIPVAETRSAVWVLDAPHPRKRGKVPGFNPDEKTGVTSCVTSALHDRYKTVSKSLQG